MLMRSEGEVKPSVRATLKALPHTMSVIPCPLRAVTKLGITCMCVALEGKGGGGATDERIRLSAHSARLCVRTLLELNGDQLWSVQVYTSPSSVNAITSHRPHASCAPTCAAGALVSQQALTESIAIS